MTVTSDHPAPVKRRRLIVLLPLLVFLAIAALVLVLMIGWVALDHRAQKRQLAKLEMQGATRRSERTVEKLA